MSIALYDLSQLKINDVHFFESHVSIKLDSGAELEYPLSQGRFHSICKLSKSLRNKWLLTDEGFGIFWPSVPRHIEFSEKAMLNSIDLCWEAICEIALQKLAKVKWNLEQLQNVDQDIIALWRLEADIYNGGFMQFLCNWGDATCQRALNVLQKIAADETYKIVFRMREILNRFDDHPDVKELTDIYVLKTHSERAEMQLLDEAFWKDPDCLAEKAMTYFGAYFDREQQ